MSGRRAGMIGVGSSMAGLVMASVVSVVSVVSPAVAAGQKVAISSGPTVSGSSVALGYTINTKPTAVAARSCTVDTATTSAPVDCGSPPTGKTSPTVVKVTVPGLANRTDPFTITVTLTDQGGRTATSASREGDSRRLFGCPAGLTAERSPWPGRLDIPAAVGDRARLPYKLLPAPPNRFRF